MKMTLRGAALAAVLAVVAIGGGGAACSTDPSASGGGVLSHTVADERALYTVEAAYFGALTAAEAAVDNGLLVRNSPQATKVRDYLTEAHSALLAARAAYKVGDASGVSAQLAATQDFVVKAWAIIPRKG